MKPGLLPLDPAKAAQFLGSDGRLEIDVPAGAVTANDVAAAGGTLALRVTEIAPASGSNAGGSGVVSLGTYLVELVDGHGNRMAHGLRTDASLKLHYGSRGSALDLDRAFVVFNGAHPQTVIGLGPFSSQPVTHDRQHHVLQAQLQADPTLAEATTPASTSSGKRAPGFAMLTASQATPSTTFTWDTYAPSPSSAAPTLSTWI